MYGETEPPCYVTWFVNKSKICNIVELVHIYGFKMFVDHLCKVGT